MALFLLTFTGLASIVLIYRAVLRHEPLLFVFAVVSFLLSAFLTNQVQP